MESLFAASARHSASFSSIVPSTQVPSPQCLAQSSHLESSVSDLVSNGVARDSWFAISDEYQILEKLGEGGYGCVYAAQHAPSDRLVAIKVLRPELTRNSEAKRRFIREMRALTVISHPNVVAILDAACRQDFCWLVTEMVPGQSLSSWIKNHGAMPLGLACDCAAQAAAALAHIHREGLIHRDIKPHNLMLTPDHCVKVLDLGLARFADGGADSLTASLNPLGTPDYMPIEQWDDPRCSTPSSDTYALGCTLYCLLAGRPPLAHRTTLCSKMRGHALGEFPDIRNVCPDIPEEIGALILRMTALDQKDRPCMRQVFEAISPFRTLQ